MDTEVNLLRNGGGGGCQQGIGSSLLASNGQCVTFNEPYSGVQ